MTTGLLDIDGVEIKDGDYVSLDGNMTADNSMGTLPNGWIFEEDDVYQVYFDSRINNWSLRIDDVDLQSAYDVKFLNHAVSLLHSKQVKIVEGKIKPGK